MRFQWRNVPVPEAHVVGLAVGILLQVIVGGRLFAAPWIGHAIGWPLIGAGAGVVIWSVLEAGAMDIAAPDALLTSGPYAWSRNPMYVGWTLLLVGIALTANAVWMLAMVLLVVLYVHFVDVRREERALEERFGEAYRAYRDRVWRYL